MFKAIDTDIKTELRINRLMWLLTIGWTLTLALVLAWNWTQIKEGNQQEAIIGLRMALQKDIIFRTWATEHGGVYVPVTPETQPNPYLTHIEEQSIITADGKQFTLLNPAYIMRQVSQIGLDHFGIYSRLTSLEPYNPINAADEWETGTLKTFQKNNNLEEISAITEFNDQLSIRVMKPFYIEDGCLKCHGYQGYQLGDLRGGITVSAPMEPYMAIMHAKQSALLPGYALIWLIGVLGIQWFLRQLIDAARNLQYLSLHDQLTGLYNRNFFEKELKRLTENPEYPISIISADVNGLKLINDTLGHTEGDRLLMASAQVLRQSLRSSDVLARVGGDEFVVLLHRTNEKDGYEVVSRIKHNILNYNGNEKFASLPLSISLGIATAEKNTKGLMDTYKEADDLMYKEKLAKGSTVKNSIIQSLISSLKDKACIDEGYRQRLEEICRKMGSKIDLSAEQLAKLALLSQMHDLGKLSMPDEILFKEGNLTAEEQTLIQQHSEKGYRIALSLPEYAKVADLILKHHEKWDGSGYPLGIKGEDIPIECRIFAIANAFCSLTSPRPYRNALTTEEAIETIKNDAGSHFDPKLVDNFISIV